MNHTKYLSQIGKKGGQKSRRTLTSEQAREMAAKRHEFRPLGYAPAHGAYYRKLASGNSVPREAFEVGEVEVNGKVRRMTRATFGKLAQACADQQTAQESVGTVQAGYTDEHGCFIGLITKATKTYRILKTRTGTEIKIGRATGVEPFTYDEWDARRQSNPEIKVTL